eukprot:1156191-Pelagomonas_calceolata.AAC.1
MLVENVSPAADQPESRAVGQSRVTPCNPAPERKGVTTQPKTAMCIEKGSLAGWQGSRQNHHHHHHH